MEDTLRQSIELFLNQFVQAWRAVELYPAGNPRIREALAATTLAAQKLSNTPAKTQDCSEENSPLQKDNFIIVRVTHEAFLFQDAPIAPHREPLSRLAEHLHQRGVRFFWLRPGLNLDELDAFLITVAGADTAKGFEKTLDQMDFEHIGLEVIEDFQLVDSNQAPAKMDMLAYLRAKQARRRAPFGDSDMFEDELPEDEVEDISDLAEFFLEIAQGSEEKTQYLYNNLSDPRRLAETLTYLAKTRPAPETGSEMPVDLVQQALGHIADTVKQLPPEIRENMARNIAEAVLTTDKAVRAQIMDTAMAAEVGKTPFMADICASLPDEIVVHLLSTHVRLHNGTANTISNFLEDFAADDQRRETVKHLLNQELRESDGQREHQVVSLLEGRPEKCHEADKKHPLSTLTERTSRKPTREARARELTLSNSELIALTEAVGCLSPQDNLERAVLNIMSLRSAGHLAPLTKPAWKLIHTAIERALDHGRFAFAADCLAHARILAQSVQDDQARLTVAEFTSRLSHKEPLDRIIQALLATDLSDAEYHALLGLLGQLGECAYEALFQAMADEPNRGIRRRLILAFIDLGGDSVNFLIRMVEHPQWYVVRNVVYLLGKIQSPAGLNALERIRHHADIRVRREVLRAAASIRGPEAETLLRHCLNDPEPMIQGLAAEWLGIINADGILEEFRTMLEKGDKRLRSGQELAAGVVRALGRIGNSSDLPLIEAFKDQSSLFGILRHDDIVHACEQAAADIRRRLSAAETPVHKETKRT